MESEKLMDYYTVKMKLMNMIAASDGRLSPRVNHVSGNWHIQTWQKNFPFVTVRIQARVMPRWSFKTPNIAHGELYGYDFTAHCFGESMEISREISDMIVDYLSIHNKQSDAKIVDITNLTTKESILQKGPKRYWRTIVTGTLITEEPIS